MVVVVIVAVMGPVVAALPPGAPGNVLDVMVAGVVVELAVEV
jgi:hypothetical protein